MYNRGVSLSCAVVWNVNERFVCTSREFWQFIFLVLDGNFFSAKTQRKVRCTIEMCPCLVLLCGIPMNDLFARAVSFGDLHFLFWKEFFYAKTQRKVRCTIEVCPWLVLLGGMSMNVMFARALSFGNFFFVMDGFFLCQNSVFI